MQHSKFLIIINVCDLFNLYYLLFLLFVMHSNATRLPNCTSNDFKYDFTDCDAYGGRWRVSVPAEPDHCTGGFPDAPIRVNKCYTSCEGGQFFNMTSLLCENCDAGHYSLGGGVTIDSFNNSVGQLPSGFHIITESTKHTPELNKKCIGWYVDPSTNQLVSSSPNNISPNGDGKMLSDDFGSGCVSVVTYTVKVVKSGRLRFTYHYQIPDDISSSLLFTFRYKLYGNDDDSSSGIDDDSNSNIRFPLPTVDQNYETVEVAFSKPGIYIFTWKSVLIGNLRGMLNINRAPAYAPGQFGHFSEYSSNDLPAQGSNDFFQNRLSSVGLIRIKKISIEGIAYASECSSCEPGTYAPNSGMRECMPCLPNTAYGQSGATSCYPCNQLTEYSYRGSTQCLKRPICGMNDFYQVPIGKCDSSTNRQQVEFKWIEPRICVDQNGIFPSQRQYINCTGFTFNQCDLGMELRQEGISEFCQFCPQTYFRDEKSSQCQPCPPFTSPYYAISVVYWNSSLPAWSTAHIGQNSTSTMLSEDYFSDNHNYLNAYFSRQCIRGDDNDAYESDSSSHVTSRYYYGNAASNDNEVTVSSSDDCNSRISWQPFHNYIRTGASTILDSYLILSVTIPGFRSIGGGEISFVYETVCSDGDRCVFLFVQTNNEESDLQLQEWNNNNIANEYKNSNRKKFSTLSHQSLNIVIKEWGQSSDGRQSFRYKIDQNISVTFSWVFKRTTSFQSYAKIYSLSITNSLISSAIKCKSCPVLSQSSPNCITCPIGEYLENMTVPENVDNLSNPTAVQSKFHCKSCPPNYILNTSITLPVGVESCIACGSNLITDNQTNVCYSDCTVQFGDESYDLRELHQPLLYRGGNLFTAGGTQYMHLFKISLCGHSKRSILSTCLNNITGFSDESSVSSGVRSYICRSTIIPDGSQSFATQSVSLGDELIGISREYSMNNITVHKEFLTTDSWRTHRLTSSDFHLFYSTKSATSACPNGRTLTVTMRCSPEVEKNSPGKAVISPPKSCPDGTCDGCNFHLLIESGGAATCRICRPYSDDYETVVGECVDGFQQVHYLNPKGCVIKRGYNLENKIQDTILRPCSVLLPRQVQIGIALATALGLLLLLLVFHFWNKNRSLEYKYTKLIENSGEGKGGDDLSFDNCCAEDHDEEDDPSLNNDSVTSNNQLIFDNNLNPELSNSPKNSQHKNKVNNRLEKSKNSKNMFGSSREMLQLFGKPSGGGGNHGVDDEGYETIHLTSAPPGNTEPNQVV